MATYRVKRNVRFGVAGLVWPAMVELTEAEAAGFLDLLEDAGPEPAAADVQPETPAEPGAAEAAAPKRARRGA